MKKLVLSLLAVTILAGTAKFVSCRERSETARDRVILGLRQAAL